MRQQFRTRKIGSGAPEHGIPYFDELEPRLLMAGSLVASYATVDNGGSSTANQNVVMSSSDTPAYTITQTISDQAQVTTLAFDGLAMMTGNLDSQSFFPPGKVADYTGFQYLRDNDPDVTGGAKSWRGAEQKRSAHA